MLLEKGSHALEVGLRVQKPANVAICATGRASTLPLEPLIMDLIAKPQLPVTSCLLLLS